MPRTRKLLLLLLLLLPLRPAQTRSHLHILEAELAALCHQLAVDCNARAAIKVQAAAITPLLVGIQVHAASLQAAHNQSSRVSAGPLAARAQQLSPSHAANKTAACFTFAVAPLMSSTRVSSFLSWWWLPLPLLMISTPASARLMCGALHLKRDQTNQAGWQIKPRTARLPQQPTQQHCCLSRVVAPARYSLGCEQLLAGL
jgi:hypothetical protein